MTQSSPEQTGISVVTKIFPMAYLLLFVKTNVEIDGANNVLPWGSHFFALGPGPHDVKISFRYLLGKAMGMNCTTIDVVTGQTVTVTYRSPWLVYLAGSLKVT